ncbi:MAG: hypothetical protein EB051_00670, partial [Chlamydiia bacterium]|nr:hypothetical protein [Chlamydiia bacterium]
RKTLYTLPFLMAAASHAALPPMPQSIREIKSVLDDEFLKSSTMTGQAILELKRTQDGFLIETTDFIIPVYLEKIPQKIMGPIQYRISFDVDGIVTKQSAN